MSFNKQSDPNLYEGAPIGMTSLKTLVEALRAQPPEPWIQHDFELLLTFLGVLYKHAKADDQYAAESHRLPFIRYWEFLGAIDRKPNHQVDQLCRQCFDFAEKYNHFLRADRRNNVYYPALLRVRTWGGTKANPFLFPVWQRRGAKAPKLSDLDEADKEAIEQAVKSVQVRESQSLSAVNASEDTSTGAADLGTDLLDVARTLGVGPNSAIRSLAEHLGLSHIEAIDGYLMLWNNPPGEGLLSEDVEIEPKWDPRTLAKHGPPEAYLPRLPEPVRDMIQPYIPDENVRKSKPRVWIKSSQDPLIDQPAKLTVGGTHWLEQKGIGQAFTHPVTYRGQQYANLARVYEEGALDYGNDLYGVVAAAIAMVTQDNCLVLGLRNARTVDGAEGTYSASCEDAWDPSKERSPHETVIRCLKEEFRLSSATGVAVSLDHVRLMAVGREWDPYWQVNLIFTVDLPCNAATVLDSYRKARDRNEHRAVVCVPLDCAQNRRVLLDGLRRRRIVPAALTGVQWTGSWRPEEAPIHPTTGAIRLLYALAKVVGLDGITDEVKTLSAEL